MSMAPVSVIPTISLSEAYPVMWMLTLQMAELRQVQRQIEKEKVLSMHITLVLLRESLQLRMKSDDVPADRCRIWCVGTIVEYCPLTRR